MATDASIEAGQRTSENTPPQTHKTTTIRNHVNLKKSTLEIVSAKDQPHKIGVRFCVDADKAFRASVALRAKEDPKNGSTCEPVSANPIARTTVSIPSVILDAGLGCVFEQDEATFVDARAFAGDELTTATTDGSRVYPMIIRLECIGDDGDDGSETSTSTLHTLDELPVHPSGVLAPLQTWTQSQTTYVELRTSSSSEWTAHVLKQKIWVQGSSYELQEIYGIDSCANGAPLTGTLADDDGKECVICLCEPRDTTVLPCRHLCMCADCAQRLRSQPSGNVCPICRNPCESLLEIKVVESQT